MTTAECPLRHHSPRLSGNRWTCPDCAPDVNRQPSPLAKLHAANDRKKESR